MALPKVSLDIATMKSGYDYTTMNATIANIDNVAADTKWPIGSAEADGLDKAVTTFLIWNNKGTSATPSTDVSDMQNCKITVVDANRGNVGAGNCIELLGGGAPKTRWVSARNDADTTKVGTPGFVPVGNLAPNPIDAGALAIQAVGQTTNVIKGTGNDGLFATTATANNFALVTTKLNIPSSATAGAVSGYLRVSFSYV